MGTYIGLVLLDCHATRILISDLLHSLRIAVSSFVFPLKSFSHDQNTHLDGTDGWTFCFHVLLYGQSESPTTHISLPENRRQAHLLHHAFQAA